ncbi:10624_t:CDS:1, partial [Paraglomus occultum]
DDAIASDIPSKDLSQYFIRGKGMDQVGEIDTDICLGMSSTLPDHTDDK